MRLRDATTAFFMPASLLFGSAAWADPPPNVTPEPIPSIFCIRVTDIERVNLVDGTPDNDFVIQFETLNWTGTSASGFNLASTVGSTSTVGSIPTIYGAGIDQDGRGGALGGSDIDASGPGLTVGFGTFDATAIHSGRGRGDIGGALNDWEARAFNATSATWGEGIFGAAAGTSQDPQNLILAGAVGGRTPSQLIPSQNPFYTAGDLDTLFDSSVDGGPGTTVLDDLVADGIVNQLDGFTLTIQDWDIGEIFSMNWFMVDSAENPIGQVGLGNQMGFGSFNLVRIAVGGALPAGVWGPNTGFAQGPNAFYDGVWFVPNPAEFAAEMGVGITAPFSNPGDNIFGVSVNVPEPATGALLGLGLLALAAKRKRLDCRV